MNELTDKSPMPFGKHEGILMGEVPARYLDWFAGECKRDEASDDALAVLDYIKRNRDAIDSELDDPVFDAILPDHDWED
jgi:uncharacterized protein (DUF3820 family)